LYVPRSTAAIAAEIARLSGADALVIERPNYYMNV